MYSPPTLRELLVNPLYKAYFKKPVSDPPGVALNNPWQVWAYNGDTERWGSRLCTTYADAYDFTRKLYRDHAYVDLCIVSRARIHELPRQFKLTELWDPYRFDWCGRCRRPTIFRYTDKPHRALRNAPAITTDEPFRCYYCGVRKVLAGRPLK